MVLVAVASQLLNGVSFHRGMVFGLFAAALGVVLSIRRVRLEPLYVGAGLGMCLVFGWTYLLNLTTPATW